MQHKNCLIFFNMMFFLFAELEAKKVDNSNLLDLLRHATAKPQKPALKETEKNLKINRIIHNQNLLENVERAQNNPNFQDALKILSDQDMKIAYRNAMGSIQLFLLDYIAQILQKYFVQNQKQKKSISLTDLLSKIAPSSSSKDQSQLSNLTVLLQKEATIKPSPSTVRINLMQLLQKNAGVVVQAKPSVSLQQLLDESSISSVSTMQQSTKKTNNLANLLPVGA